MEKVFLVPSHSFKIIFFMVQKDILFKALNSEVQRKYLYRQKYKTTPGGFTNCKLMKRKRK